MVCYTCLNFLTFFFKTYLLVERFQICAKFDELMEIDGNRKKSSGEKKFAATFKNRYIYDNEN
jgi:hypothetical protein